jgi:hypothetical protein
VVTPPTYSEVGVDLTGLGLELPCIAGLVAESRSSPSTTATLKDFVSAPTGEDCASDTRTEIHDSANDGTDIQGTTVLAGTVVHDHAFVTPTGAGGDATGTVTYTLFDNTTCNGNVIGTPEEVTISPGIPEGTESTTQVPPSSNYTTVAGTSISYSATYNADPPYTDSTGACEPLTVINPSQTLFKTATVVTTATYTYRKTNTGDVDLTGTTVTDPDCTPVRGADAPGNDDNVLNPGETWVFTCTKAITADTTNTATGSSTDPLGNVLTETDSVTITAPTVTENPPNP